ncbi:hypothetical protein [Streptomyces sp. NPDC054783]
MIVEPSRPNWTIPASTTVCWAISATASPTTTEPARGRQRTDSTHILAAARGLTRLVLEAVRAAVQELARTDPDLLDALVSAEWGEHYGRPVRMVQLPLTLPLGLVTLRRSKSMTKFSRAAAAGLGHRRRTAAP